MLSIKNILLALFAFIFSAFASIASAAGPDLTPLTSQIDFGTVITAVLAIAGLLAAVYVAIKGASTVLSMIKGR
jgi:hypothetical protein